MLQIAALPAAFHDEYLRVRHAVAVRVAVNVQILRVCFTDQQSVRQRQNHARQHELVDEHGVLVELAVALGGIMHRHAAQRRVLVLPVDLLHVGPHLGHEQPAVPVERAHDRLLDVRVGQHRFEPVAFGQLERLQLVLDAEKRSRPRRRERGRLVGGGGVENGEARARKHGG